MRAKVTNASRMKFFCLLGCMILFAFAAGQALLTADDSRPTYPAPKLSPSVDGDLADWAGIVPICLHRPEQVVYEGWGGASDLSARFWTAWDEKHLYFAAEVQDDAFHQPHAAAEMYRGDSIQIAFDVLKKNRYDYEYGFALTPAGLQAYCWHPKGADTSTIKLVAKKGTSGVNYEAAIPWENLKPFSVASGRKMGFTMMVNDADGAKREGWIEWTPGIGKSKDPSAYGTLLVVNEQTSEIISKYFHIADIGSSKPAYGADDREAELELRVAPPFATEAAWKATVRTPEMVIEKSGEVKSADLFADGNVRIRLPLKSLSDGSYEAIVEVESRSPSARCQLTARFDVAGANSRVIKQRLKETAEISPKDAPFVRFLLTQARDAYAAGRFADAAAALDSMAALAGMAQGEDKSLVAESRPVSVPGAWKPYRIHGREFWLEMPFRPQTQDLFKKAGIYDDPMYEEAALRVGWRTIQEPDSPLYKDLLKRDNAVIVRSGYFIYDRNMMDLKKEDYDRFVKDFGDRFIGIHGIHESMGWHASHFDRKAHTYPRMKRKTPTFDFSGEELVLPEPIMDVAAAYEAHRRLYRAITLQPYYKVYCTTATMMNHFVYEMGAGIVSNEIGPCGEMNTQALVAFARGAGRQFKRPWGMYIAAWGGGVAGDASTLYNFPFPWCRRFFPKDLGGWDGGPYSGPSHSLQKRLLYVSYMSGANLIGHESDQFFGSIYVANYDRHKEYSEKDWLPTLLRDTQYFLSDHGAFFREFYNDIAKKRDRGVPYAPIALLFDQHNGCAMVYSRDHLMGVVPYSEADYMMRATINTLWPWEGRGYFRGGWGAAKKRGDWETYDSVSSPFGDVFDVITNFAPADVVMSYPVIMAVGRVGINDKFAGMLKEYVRSGGAFIINIKQLPKALSGEDFLGCRITDKRHSAPASYSTIDNSLIREDKPFEFAEINPTSAQTLVCCVGTAKALPLVTRNPYGKGAVILTTPDYLKPKGSKNKMLNLFSHLMRRLTDELLPFSLQGDVEYLINKNARGWVVTLVNNEGVYKYPGRKEIIKPEEAQKATVTFKGKAPDVLEWTTNERLKSEIRDGATIVKVTVPSGEIRILEFRLPRNAN